jgi:hypothetical protein
MLTTLGVAVVLSCSLSFVRENCDCALFGEKLFSTAEQQAIEHAFSLAGLETWELRGQQVFVPRSKRNHYLQSLYNANPLPATIRCESYSAETADVSTVNLK